MKGLCFMVIGGWRKPKGIIVYSVSKREREREREREGGMVEMETGLFYYNCVILYATT